MSNYFDTNRNARIASRTDRKGKMRTETVDRDRDSVKMAATFDPRTNSTNVFIDYPYSDDKVSLDGRQARSLFRLLKKHYSATGRARSR